jgi:hypothetical protein
VLIFITLSYSQFLRREVMLCSKTVWSRLSAALKARRSHIDRLSAALEESLGVHHPELQQKMHRLMDVMRASATAFQLLVDRAHPLKIDDDNIQALFAQPDFADAARAYDASRLEIMHELQLWEPAASVKRNAHVEMTLSLFRQCEALADEQARAMSLCQLQVWVRDGILHYSGEPEAVTASETGA